MAQLAADVPYLAFAVAAAAGSLTAFGMGRPRYAGWGWWVAAIWLVAAGIVAAAALPPPLGPALATPLLLQWPVVTLIGLRRFHGRVGWAGSARGDCTLLAAVATAAALAAALPASSASPWVVAACSVAVHLYAATLLAMAPATPGVTPLHGLAAAMALAAFAPWLVALATADGTPTLESRSVAAALGAIVLAFVTLTVVCDRTERQLRESRRRLRTLANLDALTQVPNRRHFDELAQQALRSDPPGSTVLLLLDVDHFKQINDHLGHAAGDRALCLVSGSVLEQLRAPDVAGRHGGDEFVLLLRRASTADAMGVAARIVADVQRRAPGSQLPALSLSFGMVQMRPGEDLASALRRADQALYEAKRQGRSRAVSADGDEQEPVFSESQSLGLTA